MMLKTRAALGVFVLVCIFSAVLHDIRLFAQGRSTDTLSVVLQERLNQHITEEDRREARFEQLQRLVQEQAVANEKRISTLESIAESQVWWLRAVGAAVIAIAVKEVFLFRVLRRRIGANDDVTE